MPRSRTAAGAPPGRSRPPHRTPARPSCLTIHRGAPLPIGFGNRGVIADNDPVEQEKAMKFNAQLTNAVIFHNALDIAEIVRQLLEEGWEIDPEDLAHISPYLTEHINRFGEYSTQRARHPARRVRDQTRRRLHSAARAGPDRRRPRPGRLTAHSPEDSAVPPEQYGRWTSVDTADLAQEGGQDAALALACSLHALA
ncbi:Tn3 family transposase [Streptomyces sp. NPDC102274]|uniref:Tn3 family transposase n=1 Tax=Streptomyces sp. NPDC102274 TaxID=3366151 RepID=UPI00380CBF54